MYSIVSIILKKAFEDQNTLIGQPNGIAQITPIKP